MSVPIAVVGWMPKMRISSGVISEPPPMPVMPTSTPMPNPKRTIAGSIDRSCSASEGTSLDFDFPDLLGQECGVRQDTRMRLEIAGVSHSYGDLRALDSLSLNGEEHGVLGLVGPSGCGKSTLLELICGLQGPG